MTVPKAHHYIPRFYLDGFTGDGGKLWVYESDKSPRPSTPKNSGYEKYFYALEQDGERHFDVEETIANLEGYTSPTIQKLRSGNLSVDAQERNDIAGFVALMFTRTPYFHDNINRIAEELEKHKAQVIARTPGQLEAAYRKLEERGDKPKVSVEEVRKFMLSDSLVMKQRSREWTIRVMFSSLLQVQPIIENMRWNWLLAAENEYFLTSDNPVAVVDPAMEGSFSAGFLSSPLAQFTFPIDKKLCLYCRWRGDEETHQLGPSRTKEVNKRTILRAYRFVYASEKSGKIELVLNESRHPSA